MSVVLLESGDTLLIEDGGALLIEGPTGAAVTGDAGFVVLTVGSDRTGVQHSSPTQLGAFDVGDKPLFTATFKYTASRDTGDPTAVTWMWLTSAGVETTYVYLVDVDEVSRTGSGAYTFTPPTITASGPHWVRVKGTGGLTAAGEARVGVRISAFTQP